MEPHICDTMVINEKYIQDILYATKNPSKGAAQRILKKAIDAKGLKLKEAAILLNSSGGHFKRELFNAAGFVKRRIYGERLVFFAPLYISDFCVNDCCYCNFHSSNKAHRRRRLTLEEIGQQVEFLLNAGHKRLLVEAGEDPLNNDIDYVVEAIGRIYSVKTPKGGIRRVNVNIAAATVDAYRKLKQAKIGTYQLFQETYHRQTYEKLHSGPKRNYDRQIEAHFKAFEAGIDDLGLGALFGLYDWRFEALALIAHSQYMEKRLGVGPHTISVPRFCPAPTVSYKPQYPVTDEDFLKIIAILRLAVPYTGLIISTREAPQIRKAAFSIGISQASACSVTTVGGYGRKRQHPQFTISDERPLAGVIKDILPDGLLPSFCTACYRLGRTGHNFMGITKAGGIHNFCRPNGLLTFAEYLEDFACPAAASRQANGKNGLYKKGYKLIDIYLRQIKDNELRKMTRERLEMVRDGQRDLYF